MKQFAKGFVLGIAWVMLIASVLPWLAPSWWIAELMSILRLQYALLALLFALIAIWKKQQSLFILSLLTCSLNLFVLLPYWLTSAPETTESQLSLMLINVYSHNDRFEDVEDYIEQQQPDVVVIEELTPKWTQIVDSISPDYQYQRLEVRTDNFGIAVLSKYPLSKTQIGYFGDAQVPTILTQLQHPQQSIDLIATHPVPPKHLTGFQYRNQHLRQLAEVRDHFSDHLILIGDLNTSPFSMHFRHFVRQMRLVDTQVAHGLQPSWPSFTPPLMTPLDHCLISPSLQCTQRTTGPYNGSDHLPLYVEIGW